MARLTSSKRLLVLLAALALLAAACGDDDDTAATPEGDRTTTTAAPGSGDDADDTDDTDDDQDDDSAGLGALLLTEADMPAGYTLIPDDGSDDDDSAPDFCEEAFERFEDDLDSEEADVEFEKGEAAATGGAMVMQALARSDEDVMAERFDELPAAFEQCTDFTLDDDGTTMTGTFSPLEFSPYGDGTHAMHLDASMVIQDMEFPVAGDMVFVREGGTVMIVMSFVFGEAEIPVEELDQIVSAGYAKL